MKKINLINEIIKVSQVDFIAAVNCNTEFGITTDAKIIYPPFIKNKAYIFIGQATRISPPSDNPEAFTHALGKDFKITSQGAYLQIQCSKASQKTISFNLDNACYENISTEGMPHFIDEKLATMSWHATEFDIGCREIIKVIESKVDGVLLQFQGNVPFQSSMGFIKDHEKAHKIVADYIVKNIKNKMKNNPEYCDSMIDEDQEEALKFFGITV
ncbi:MAG: hypothetical protein OEW60_02465 [Thiovulaceae bacterium]|nr:hypothetical protein [Sulfurimonadaceae bacterium]